MIAEPPLKTHRLPAYIVALWAQFDRPPLAWNKINTYKSLQKCIEPEQAPNN